MIKKQVMVNILEGREDRPIAKLVQVTNNYKSRIYFLEPENNRRINGKSMMGMMTLALYPGEPVTVEVDGEDEKEAMEGIENYLTGQGK